MNENMWRWKTEKKDEWLHIKEDYGISVSREEEILLRSKLACPADLRYFQEL